MSAKVNAKAVAIIITPLWSVAVITVKGAVCPGRSIAVEFEAIPRIFRAS